ncbi:tail fiber domain-containing protein [Aeromonas bestiarum]|uniref:Tail fiber domain-containing protein n=1 Tax=Aeromonas bestiarum TaxID=105751 RepID=A0ABT7Q5V7_9GAMM|nr:tail fiber domain-containing protein [Aeromonas bestiarum]MDM5074714.1 tail fiber domain-containing protein [Aeromonas bestiarum]
MYWPDTQTGVDVEPARKPVASAVRKYFTEGGAGTPPTVPGGDWFNQFTNEMLNVLAAAGIEPSKTDDDQLLLAIQTISKAPGVMTRGNDKFSIMQGRSGEYRQDTLTRGLAIELNDPITGSGFAGASNTYMFNRMWIADDRVDAQNDGTPGSKVDGLIVQHNFGGAGARGGRHAAEFMLSQGAPTESDNADRNYVGVVGYCASTAGDGGTDMSAGKKGAYFGGNFFTTIKNSQFVSHANGCESNVLIDAASSVYYRSGYSAVSAGDNQATKYDAAFSVGALGAVGAQWLDGLLVGVQNGRNPVSRSIIRGESASMQSLASFSGTIPGGLIVSDTDDRFNFRIDRLEMHYANASLKLGAKTAVNTPFIDAYTDATGNRAGRIIFTGTAPTADNGVCNVQFRQTTVKEIVPSSPNAYSCGTASLPWSGIFTQTAPTITSDENYKTKPLAITDAMLDAASEVDWVQYQYLDRVEAKGPDGARWHFGAIAQRFIEAFNRHGLDAHDYGFLCYDEWDDQWGTVITNEGATVTKTRIVQCPVVETVTREIPVYTEQEDGSIVVTMASREALVPKLEKVFVYNADGKPLLTDDGSHSYELREVMVDVEEEYTELAEPEYEEVLEIAAGSRYGIRYEEALALEAALQRRERKRDREAFEAFKLDIITRLTAREGKA